MSEIRIPIRTPGGTYEVFVRRAGSHPRNKLLVVHGVPGANHEYLGELEKLVDAEVIYYDQLGCGRSDRPDDNSLWTIPRYLDELVQVRDALGLGEQVTLFGHSWGGILALEYAFKYGEKLEGLIIANIMSSIPELNRRLRTWLPSELGISLDHPEAVERYLARYVCRQVPWPDCVTRSFAQINPQVAEALRGPDPILIGGELASWDRSRDLSQIGVPTLIIHGGEDTMDPAQMEAFAHGVQRGSYLLCPRTRHMPMHDEPAVFSAGVNDFLSRLDAR